MGRRAAIAGLLSSLLVAAVAAADPVQVGRYAEIPYGVRRDHAYATEQGDARRTGRVRGRAPASAPERVWERSLTHRRPRGPIVAHDGTLYLGTMGGLMALAPDGTELWSAPVGGVYYAPSFLPSGDIVAATRGGLAVVVGRDGTLRRSADLSAPAHGSPLVLDDGSVVIATVDRRVRRLDSSLRVLFDVGLPDGNGATLATTSQGDIAAVAGRELVILSTSGALVRTSPLGGRATASPAVADDGTLWIALAEGQLLGLGPSGRERARVDLGGRPYDEAAIAIGADAAVRVPTVNAGLVCVGPAGGERWRVASQIGFNAPASVDEEGTTLVVDRGGRMLAIGADGQERWAVAVGTYVYQAPVLAADGTIYIVTERGAVQAWRAPPPAP